MVGIAPTTLVRAAVRVLIVGLTAALSCAVIVVGDAAAAQADQVRRGQWQLTALDASDAWKLSTGEGVVVAVVDSGVDALHPDLVGQVLPGVDLVADPEQAAVAGSVVQTDPVGHGTTVAGLIAGSDSDSAGVVGIAPGAKILPVRVLDQQNKYDDPEVVAAGIRWAVEHGAGVINLSLGGALRSEAIAAALRYAAAADVVVVACTGNIATDPSVHEVWYPAREPGVVAVAGLNRAAQGASVGSADDVLWAGSLTGPETVLTAPADSLTGARPGGGYWQVQGTSFAAPLVAGVASLIRARYPQMSAANVINRMIETARDLGSRGRDDRFGYGEVDPVAALRERVPEVVANPLATVPPRPAPSGGRGPLPSAPAVPREGGAAPLPAVETSVVLAEPVADGRRLGSSVTAGLMATILIMVAGAVGVLLHHRRRHRRRATF
ncbi:type VII secretion-associated serine protease mycosin [Dactylosporangium sp. AC04546]|uniref:type VII secretion-associated serine protease mycosin n=1 Tax=Dactylosporangium sp. AC04546 TaxID=2862460 RepID=UPI001EDE9853|nr:type VII secretion-associated serine protease mycosin [Dactylosporangium sp. AC04546]WVK84451.1 type VII secretion-associated serine protease mycosin [Dactylosporangium sp. AC04546]